jgi:hypothetical protein
MEAAVFFMLACRLPAYRGVLRAVLQAQQQAQPGGTGPNSRTAPRGAGRYERSSPMANSARAADTAPPATAASLTALNTQLGANWFTHRTVGPGA